MKTCSRPFAVLVAAVALTSLENAQAATVLFEDDFTAAGFTNWTSQSTGGTASWTLANNRAESRATSNGRARLYASQASTTTALAFNLSSYTSVTLSFTSKLGRTLDGGDRFIFGLVTNPTTFEADGSIGTDSNSIRGSNKGAILSLGDENTGLNVNNSDNTTISTFGGSLVSNNDITNPYDWEIIFTPASTSISVNGGTPSVFVNAENLLDFNLSYGLVAWHQDQITAEFAYIDNVSLTAIPEPSAALLGGLGLLALLRRRR